MTKDLSKRNSISSSWFTLILFLISCGTATSEKKGTSQTNLNSIASSPNSSSIPLANQAARTGSGFSTANICSLPKEIAGNSPFANIGGGTWGKWGDSEGELAYGCNGGNDSLKLEKATAKVSAAYGALGAADTVHFVFVKYTALQYGGKAPVEEGLRNRYFDFCDDLAAKFYGQKLPEKFKKRLSDETGYSNPGAQSEYHEKAGTGFVNLTAVKDTSALITLEVRFFPSEAEYKKYKDS